MKTIYRLPQPILSNDRTESLMQRYLTERRLDIADALSVCESPIEVMMALGLLGASDGDGPFLRLNPPKPRARVAPIAKGRAGALFAQWPIQIGTRSIRADFAMFGSRRVIIELDGHEFHERTREQARSDKSRDRALSADGWLCMRFTGSEVYHDVVACANEVLSALGIKAGVAPPVAAKPESPRKSVRSTFTSQRSDDLLEQIRQAEKNGDDATANACLIAIFERAKQRHRAAGGA